MSPVSPWAIWVKATAAQNPAAAPRPASERSFIQPAPSIRIRALVAAGNGHLAAHQIQRIRQLEIVDLLPGRRLDDVLRLLGSAVARQMPRKIGFRRTKACKLRL